MHTPKKGMVIIMSKSVRVWHPNFINYMDMIAKHPNYKGLPITRKKDGSYSWIATAKSTIGRERKIWCEAKAKDLGFSIQAGVYADVMLAIHPTKKKVCQTCGKEMSLYYLYPNANFLKSLNKKFDTYYSDCDNIEDIWDDLIQNGIPQKEIASFLIEKGGLALNVNTASKQEIIAAIEYACRKGDKKCLGPGAMSNFPDRYDGFHTYNRCCRSIQDTGRSKENLKSYTKDRRAYEYWSDGNIHAANQFMGSAFFKGVSADHVGPISLGFVHDPRYLQPMLGGENSSKRDRLQLIDIEKIIETEARTGVYPMSWYSCLIWEFIKANYKSHIPLIATDYRDALKQNMANFMFILWYILETCGDSGESFLIKSFLEPNYSCFDFSYSFNERGEIIGRKQRHFTERNTHETDRYTRIAIKSVYDYNDKNNRHLSQNLIKSELDFLETICKDINSGLEVYEIKKSINDLMVLIQNRAIRTFLA